MKGEVAQVKEERPKKPVAESMIRGTESDGGILEVIISPGNVLGPSSSGLPIICESLTFLCETTNIKFRG
jgi:hypothetical protein